MTLYTIMGESWFCWLVVIYLGLGAALRLYDMLAIFLTEMVNVRGDL